MEVVGSMSSVRLVVCSRQSSFGFKAKVTTWFEEGVLNTVVKMQEECGI